jgi:hypothetical protein
MGLGVRKEKEMKQIVSEGAGSYLACREMKMIETATAGPDPGDMQDKGA